MPPALLLLFLVAAFVALVPVRRLQLAGWSPGSLFTAWILYTVGIIVGVRFPGPFKVLLPILVLAFVAPFVAGPERLTRFLGRRRGEEPHVIIDVTPRPAPGLPDPDDAPRKPRSSGRRRTGGRPPEDRP